MKIDVKFSECTSEIPVSFGEFTEIKNGFTQDEVDKLMSEARETGYETGKQAQWDKFWDVFQDYGDRTDYAYAFFGGWLKDILRPKYDIKPIEGHRMFYASQFSGDLAKWFADCNIKLDLSQTESFFESFFNAKYITRVPVIDLRGIKNNQSYGVFHGCTALVTIDKVIVKEDMSDYGNFFLHCMSLVNMSFEGSIGGTMGLGQSPLSRESIYSVINHLSDNATGQTVTFNKKAVNTAFETTAESADGSTSEEWLELIGTKSNWSFSLL